MSVETMSPKTLNIIISLIRKFLQGKIGKDMYLSFISWAKVWQKKEDGCLDIRDLKLFNKALLLKMTWQVAANQDHIWITVLKAKYYSKGGFWGIKGTKQTSRLWKAIQNLKEEILCETRWQVGDGHTIPALNQPLFQDWELQQIRTNE